MEIVKMDLLDVSEGIIAHQVNVRGVMGAGVALSIRKKYPKVFEQYSHLCRLSAGVSLLGFVQPVRVSDSLVVLNVFGQEGHRRGRRETSYDATATAWEKISERYGDGRNLFIPYLMGCGLAGGDWSIYEAIVSQYCPRTVACELPTPS